MKRTERVRNAGRQHCAIQRRSRSGYAYGLRRRELVMLDLTDFGPNPHVPRFGNYGAMTVRWAKGTKGSGPRRRTVLTTPEFSWVVELLEYWCTEGRQLFATSDRSPAFDLREIRCHKARLTSTQSWHRAASITPGDLSQGIDATRDSAVSFFCAWIGPAVHLRQLVDTWLRDTVIHVSLLHGAIGRSFSGVRLKEGQGLPWRLSLS